MTRTTGETTLKKPRTPRLPWSLVLVEWKDHVSQDNWNSRHNVDNKPEMCLSVGWLYKEDEEGLSLVRDVDPSGDPEADVGNIQYILKNCITKYVVIKK